MPPSSYSVSFLVGLLCVALFLSVVAFFFVERILWCLNAFGLQGEHSQFSGSANAGGHRHGGSTSCP